MNNTNNHDIIVTSFLNDSQFSFSPNRQIDTIKANDHQYIVNVGFIGEVNLDPIGVFDSLKIEERNGNVILLTDKVDTLNWKTEVSAFVDANKVTYGNVLVIN